MGRQSGRGQLACALLEHGLDPMYRLGRHGLGLALLCCLKGRGQIHQALDLNAVPGSHVCDVIEVRGSADHLTPSVCGPGEGAEAHGAHVVTNVAQHRRVHQHLQGSGLFETV